MRLDELMAQFRSRADDTAKPYLWRDEEIIGWINEAEAEACERANLLLDSRTAGVSHFPVQAGEGQYVLHPAIIDIRRVKLQQSDRILKAVPLSVLDEQHPGWEQWVDTPCRWTLLEDHLLRLVPAPAVNDALCLLVSRRPMHVMALDSDTPEINAFYHPYLLSWVLHRAYQKRDADTYNENQSRSYEAEFEGVFGPRLSAHVRQLRASGRNWLMGYGG